MEKKKECSRACRAFLLSSRGNTRANGCRGSRGPQKGRSGEIAGWISCGSWQLVARIRKKDRQQIRPGSS